VVAYLCVVCVLGSVLIDVFPLGLVRVKVACEIVEVCQLDTVFVGFVGELAVGLVNHVLANGGEAAELLPTIRAEQTQVADRHLLTKIGEETTQIHEQVAIGNEEAVGSRHVFQVALRIGRTVVAEQAVAWVDTAARCRNTSLDVAVAIGIAVVFDLVGRHFARAIARVHVDITAVHSSVTAGLGLGSGRRSLVNLA
jgi:hypothetical protein